MPHRRVSVELSSRETWNGYQAKELGMPLMNWKEEFSVNVRSFDAQHKKLIDLINQLHEAMTRGRGKDVMERVIGELVMYTKFHFTNEEDLMRDTGFPGLERHQQLHAELTRQVMEFQSAFTAGRTTLSVNLMVFLQEWLTNHIQGTDKQYSAFLKAKGVS